MVLFTVLQVSLCLRAVCQAFQAAIALENIYQFIAMGFCIPGFSADGLQLTDICTDGAISACCPGRVMAHGVQRSIGQDGTDAKGTAIARSYEQIVFSAPASSG